MPGIVSTLQLVSTNIKGTVISIVEFDDTIRFIKSNQSIFSDMFEIMDMMIYVLILAVIVLYNLGSMSYMERYRELATLKVVGFKDKKISHWLTEKNMWTTIVETFLEIPVVHFVLDDLVSQLSTEYGLLRLHIFFA